MGGQLLGQGRRKGDAAHGDDTTLTRFVKTGDRAEHRKPRLIDVNASHIVEGRTKFGGAVKRVDQVGRLLVSGHNSIKLGRDVRKAKFRGYWIYTLSLEERKTCPDSCQHWPTCYGNNMPFAKRIDHTDPEFLPTLEAEISALLGTKNRIGLLIRLHTLGDFFSVEYVQFWMRMLRTYSNLAVFGYTARHPVTPIGDAVWVMNRMWPSRCMIRFSDAQLPEMSTVSIGDETGCPPNAFICPEQTGKTRCCATCGACWSTTKNVAFMEH